MCPDLGYSRGSQRTVGGKLRMEFIVSATVFPDPPPVSPGGGAAISGRNASTLRQARATAEHMAARLGPCRYDSEPGCRLVENPSEPPVVISLERLGVAA